MEKLHLTGIVLKLQASCSRLTARPGRYALWAWLVTCENWALCMDPVVNWDSPPPPPARSTAGSATEPMLAWPTLELWCWMIVALQQETQDTQYSTNLTYVDIGMCKKYII